MLKSNNIIVFIHGLGSSSKDWQEQVKFFSKDYLCITVDLRGHGKAPHDQPLTIKRLAQDVIEFVENLKIDKINLVGISLGGMVAFEIATIRPDLLKSLTIVNAIPELILKDFKRKVKFYWRLFLIKIFGMKIFAKILAKKLFPYKNQQKLREKFIKNFIKNNKNSYLTILKNLPNWSVSSKIHKIKCSTLFLASENDYTSLSEKEFFAKKIGGKIIVIKNSHHALPAEKPKEFNFALKNFLDSVQ